MTARQLAIAGARYHVDGEGYSTVGNILHVDGRNDAELEHALLPMALANDAVIRDGECIGDPTEGALVVLAAKGGLDVQELRNVHPRVAEVPFDAAYKLMATFHDLPVAAGGERMLRCFVKGAPDVLLARSASYIDVDGAARPLGEGRDLVLAENERLASEGMRVLAVARRDVPATAVEGHDDHLHLVADLELLALVGIVDPPRKEARDAIKLCKDAGIRVRMITGDHAVTAAAIAGQLGIEGRALTGAEFAAMTDEELNAAVEDIGVVARVAPEDKVRLVSTLKAQGNVVAMTGDGVNDAPALTRADIGVAMGITGTEVTKDAAEMILTDDNFATIVTAVQRGRALYDNLMKYVRVQMVFLAGFILTFVGAGIFTIADGQPLLPLQILWINFATDVVLALGLGFDAETPGLMQRRPRPTDQPVVPVPLGLRLGFAGLLIAIGTLSVVAWAEDRYGLATATTMGLVTTGLLHIAAAIEWRDPIHSIFNRATIANGRFNVLVLLAFVLTFLATTIGGLQRMLDTVELDGDQWRACLVAVIGYLVLAELGKFILRHTQKGAIA
jgi:Ca2+-transporting ATPase